MATVAASKRASVALDPFSGAQVMSPSPSGCPSPPPDHPTRSGCAMRSPSVPASPAASRQTSHSSLHTSHSHPSHRTDAQSCTSSTSSSNLAIRSPFSRPGTTTPSESDGLAVQADPAKPNVLGAAIQLAQFGRSGSTDSDHASTGVLVVEEVHQTASPPYSEESHLPSAVVGSVAASWQVRQLASPPRSEEGHLPSEPEHEPAGSCCSGHHSRPTSRPEYIPCTFAMAHPERPCPATAIESLIHLQDTGMPAVDILRMIRGLMGIAPSQAELALPAPFHTPTPAQSPEKSGRHVDAQTPMTQRTIRARPVSLQQVPSRAAAPKRPMSIPTAPAQAPLTGDETESTNMGPSAPAQVPHTAPTSPPAPTAVADLASADTPASAPAPRENSRLAAFLNLNANSKIATNGPGMQKTQSNQPVSRAINGTRRASMPAPPSAFKDATPSNKRISFHDQKVKDKNCMAHQNPDKDFAPDSDRPSTSEDRAGSHSMSPSQSRRTSRTPGLKHKASLITDTSLNGDEFDGSSEAEQSSNGVLSRARPRIQWASFLPPLASALSNPENFSTGVATGRLFGLIHTRLGERRQATPMLLLAGAFLSAVGGDATGSRLGALRLDEALSAAGMIESFLQSAMLAELAAPVSVTPPSNFTGKFAEARGTAVSAHTRVRSNVNVLKDVLNRHLMATVQRHSSKLAQEVFTPEPKVMDVLERTRMTCVHAGLTLTLWRSIALAYLAEVYIAVMHHLLKLRNDGYSGGHRQAYQRVQEALNAIDTWAKKQDVRVNLSSVIGTYLGELITPSPTVSPIVSALDRVRAEHSGGHAQALAILRLAGLPDREIRALDKLSFAIEDACERSNAGAKDLPNGELVVKALAWSGFD